MELSGSLNFVKVCIPLLLPGQLQCPILRTPHCINFLSEAFGGNNLAVSGGKYPLV